MTTTQKDLKKTVKKIPFKGASLEGLIRPFKVKGPYKALLKRTLQGLIRPFKGLKGPAKGPYKALLRAFPRNQNCLFRALLKVV